MGVCLPRVPNTGWPMPSDPIRDEMERPEFFLCESAVPYRPREAASPVYGGARLASQRDLSRLLTEPDDPFVELPHVAPLVRAGADGTLRLLPKERLHLSRELVCRNLLAVGQVGSGKTQNVLLPALFGALGARPDASFVVVDTKGDLYDVIGRWADRHRPDLDLRLLNFTDPDRSEGYNPHDPVNEPDPFDAAHTIVHAGEDSRNVTHRCWLEAGTRIACALQHANYEEFEYSSPGLVHHQLEQPTRVLLSFLGRHLSLPYVAGSIEYLGNPHQNSDTTLAEVRNYFRTWRDSNLSAVTGHSELRLPELVKWPTVLVVEADQADLHRTRPMLCTFFAQLQRFVLRESLKHPGNRLPQPLLLMMDEFASFGRIPNMPQFLNTSRSRNVGVIAAVQTLNQIRSTYHTEGDDVIAGFSSKVFLSPVDVPDAQYASQLSGTMTVAVPRETESGAGAWEGSSHLADPSPRQLLLPEEVRLPPLHPLLGRAGTLFLADTPPVQCYFRAAHDTPGTREAIAAAARHARVSYRRGPLAPALPEKWLTFAKAERERRGKGDGEFASMFDSVFGNRGDSTGTPKGK